MTTNRDNSFRLADSQETVNDNTLYLSGELDATIGAIDPVLNNTITFNTNNEPMLELRANGDIYIHGRLAANDLEVVQAMRQFLSGQGLLR